MMIATAMIGSAIRYRDTPPDLIAVTSLFFDSMPNVTSVATSTEIGSVQFSTWKIWKR